MKYKVILLVVSTFLLTGCTEEKINKDINDIDNEEINLDIELDNIAQTQKASRVIGEPRKFSLNEIEKIFCNGNKIENIESNEYATWGNYNNKDITSLNSGGFSVESETFSIIRTIALDIDKESSLPRPSDLFKKDKLDFINKQEAIEECKLTLDKLKIDYNDNPKVYSLDYETLQKRQDKFMEGPNFKEGVDLGQIKIKDKWTKDDEGYYIIFDLNINDIKVEPLGYEDKNSSYLVSGSQIVCWVNKSGLDSISIDGNIYEIDNIKEETNLKSIEECMLKVNNKYKDIILGNKKEIVNIELQYVPVIKEVKNYENGDIFFSKYEFEPCWVFSIKSEIDTRDKSEVEYVYRYERVSAITGDFIE